MTKYLRKCLVPREAFLLNLCEIRAIATFQFIIFTFFLSFRALDVIAREAVFLHAAVQHGPVSSPSHYSVKSTAKRTTEHAKLWLGGMTVGRQTYEIDVTRLALEKSRTRYGNFTLSFDDRAMKVTRAMREMVTGTGINIISSPPIDLKMICKEKEIFIASTPIMNGLLGYRKLVTLQSKLESFARIKTLQEIKNLIVGMERNWGEIGIFESNGFNVSLANSDRQLPLMLYRGRFDYLSFGVHEIEQQVKDYNATFGNMVVVPDIVIYYPYHVNLHVATKNTELAARIEYGLKKASLDGSLQQLFNRHFQALIDELDLKETKLFIIENPLLNKEDNVIMYPALLHNTTN